jgi:hypothetical protein
MKIVKKANGQKTVKMSKEEWADFGKTAGWLEKEALGEAGEYHVDPSGQPTTPGAGQEVADVQLSEQAIMGMLKQNFGYTVTPVPGGVFLSKQQGA